jgi:hypothetical protein
MNNYYKKLNLVTPNLDVVKGKVVDRYGSFWGKDFMGISYNKYFFKNEESQRKYLEIQKLIPEDKKGWFTSSFLTINSPILPHVDWNTNTTINFYTQTSGWKTTFHTEKDGAEDRSHDFGKAGGYDLNENNAIPRKNTKQKVYMWDDVNDVCSFTAKENEVYILNVNELHSVTGGEGLRNAVCLQTILPFDEVVDIFKSYT